MADPTPVPPIDAPAPPQPPSPAVSPTGAPVLSPKLAPWFFGGMQLTGAITAVAATMEGVPKPVLLIAGIGFMFFSGMLGLTPGARR